MDRPDKPQTRTRRVGICVECKSTKRIAAKGLCRNCYMRDRRKTASAVQTLEKQIQTLETIGLQSLDHAARAKQILESALPIAAQGLVDSIPIAASKGNSRPAEVLLREFQIDSAEPGKRLLHSQFSAGNRDDSDKGGRVQVVIGLSLGGTREQAKTQGQLAANADLTAQVIETKALNSAGDRLDKPINDRK